MLVRIGIAILGVFALTAFAPAPLPKMPKPVPPEKLFQALQGEWRLTKTAQLVDGKIRYETAEFSVYVRVQGNHWAEAKHERLLNSGLTRVFRLNAKSNPATLDLLERGTEIVERAGILKIEGKELTFSFHLQPPQGLAKRLGKKLPELTDEQRITRPANFFTLEDETTQWIFTRNTRTQPPSP
jgi:uncharacterized protein (TIGR03067 family)